MKSRKILSSLVLLIFSVGILAASQTLTVKAAGGQVVIGTTDSIDDLDPADAYDYFSSNILVQLTHGLMQMPLIQLMLKKALLLNRILLVQTPRNLLSF